MTKAQEAKANAIIEQIKKHYPKFYEHMNTVVITGFGSKQKNARLDIDHPLSIKNFSFVILEDGQVAVSQECEGIHCSQVKFLSFRYIKEEEECL